MNASFPAGAVTLVAVPDRLESPLVLFGLPILLIVLLLLLLRRSSTDRHIRRRTLLLSGLLGLFVLLRVWLAAIPETIERLARAPGVEEPVAVLVANPLHQAVGVGSLIVGLLAVLLLSTLLVVELFLVRRLQAEVPKILPDVTVVTAFFFGVLLILYYRTELDVTGLLTTSAVISVVVGLALQDTLGNLFSGLALQTERSFRVGHWVRFGEYEGVVTDISWRSTTLRNRDNDLVVIPNAVIGKSALLNYSAPSRSHRVGSEVGCHYRHPPAEVVAALERAASRTEGVLAHPEPRVRITRYGDFALYYRVRYSIRDYADEPRIRTALMTRIWYVFERRGIEIPYPARTVFLEQVTPEAREAERRSDLERVKGRLARCDLFEPLGEEELETLARAARLKRFFTGETVLRQGEAGDSLFVIDEGRVEVLVQRDGREERLAELGFPSFFGEMSLMTGEPRSGTVRALEPTRFIVVERDALREILRGNPELATRISETLASRKEELDVAVAALATDGAEGREEKKQEILGRIRQLFGF